ncbi:MAG TPA: HRDC domain-containing protein [Blastocatellia bacterium]|nr:HRDC domain-containing protein [Blastocatellia bacterium]HMV85179.1 HRDC domain-containing protein [Blastocatellia bacterium]HMX26139.1 HRDC domain-containing protein [Blastocatellia bacterium]HMY71279.1 HRDC domain-containing protein [Blastocatellia bacterium]HMZ18454.1 HRDC domain-containing protein [Blastocatellia bacterium]
MTAIAYQYLVDPDEARAALVAFANQPVIGLDTETYWDFNTRQNTLSLLQLASPSGDVIVIDALSAGLEEARSLIENPAAMMAAHSAKFDDGVLRQAGFGVAGLVDTLRLSRRTLRLRSFSLASVSDHLFGLKLDKTYQQSDWRRRPLSREQLDYAALDAQIALQVFQELSERLTREGRLSEELHRARVLPPGEGENGRSAPRIKRPPVQLRPLTAEERRVFDKLRDWRHRMARQESIPVYLVCSDKTLEHLIIARPRTVEDLSGIFGLGDSKISRYGAEMLAQLTQG